MLVTYSMQELPIHNPNGGAGTSWKGTCAEDRKPGSGYVIYNFVRGDGYIVSRWLSLN